MKYRLDFSSNVKRLNGEEVNPVKTLGTALAENIETQADPTKNARQLGVFAIDLYKTGILELDVAQVELLQKYVEDSTQTMAIFFKYALLEVFANKTEVA